MLDKAKNKGELRPHLRNFNVRWFEFDLSDVHEMRFTPQEAARYTVVAGDVVVCEGGYPGRAAIWDQDEPIYFQKALHRVRFHEPQRNKWFLYYLYAKDFEGTLRGHFSGTGIQHFTGEALAKFEIPLPPLPELQRIVGILDEAFGGIAAAKANAEKNLRSAQDLFEAHIQSVFARRGDGWTRKSLGEIAQIKGGKRVPKGYKLLAEPTAFPYLRVSDFSDSGTIDMSDLRYVSAEVRAEIERYVITSDDLYLSIAGTIGKTGIVPPELDGANLTENACRLVVNPGISNRFVYYFTLTRDFLGQAGVQTRTAAQPKLALSRLATIRLGIPDLGEQERLADEFNGLRDETRLLDSVYRKKLAALDELKQSLLHQAFSGQL
jgi:type I restriction enzyme S subunit